MVYSGALLVADGRSDSEMSRKIGSATCDFHLLQKHWGHANVPLQDKLAFFQSLVVAKLWTGNIVVRVSTEAPT